ncbi:MAG: class I SAM-dependent methyltransferase, partial [Chloroflexi bacterium]|nr:class I SAM-dependent methyltransferase [Chloroflexota bacterium]
DGSAEIVSEMYSATFGEDHTFRCDCFDVEHDRFPYDDNTFDLVLFCEVIEHLFENPVHTLSEIHRVLKPGGAMVLTTPNVSRFDNLVTLGRGRNIYDPYHLGSPFAGSRHLREYTFAELRDLVNGCGFEIDRMRDHDIYPRRGLLHAVLNEFMNRLVSRLTSGHYRFHLFVRARKTAAPFQWRFPESIFASGHLTMYAQPRDAFAVVGENDALHFQMGWGDARRVAGRLARRAGSVGDIYLRCDKPVTDVTVTFSGGAGEIQTAHDRSSSGAFVLLGVTPFDAPAGAWTDVHVPVNADFEPGNLLHVRLAAPAGVDVCAVRAE